MKKILLLTALFFVYGHCLIAQPNTIPGLAIWFSADTGVTTPGGSVSQWNDLSGNGHDAVQAAPSSQPAHMLSIPELNNKPAIRFDGVDDILLINSGDTVGSAFIVVNWRGALPNFPDYNGIMSAQTFPPLNSILFMGLGGSSSLYATGAGDVMFLGPDYYVNAQQTIQLDPLNRYKIISAVDDALDPPLPDFVIGRQSDNVSRYWNGDIAEIIVYRTQLTPAERMQIIQYLDTKYAHPVNLGPDLNISYGFCDSLHAGGYFLSYLWSSGDTTESIPISAPGSYTVTATDVFGFITTDTINVTFPGNLSQSDTTICLGGNFTWNTSLGSGYSFDWEGFNTTAADTNASLNITQPGQYWVIVTDTVGCSKISDTVTVSVDSFEVTASLGPDVPLCSGNTIALTAGASEAQTYLWSDSTTGTSMTVQTTGTYWVSVTNSNGCVANDSIYVTIVGVAPSVNFSALTVCNGDTTFFTDLTPPTDSAIAWSWNFGEPSSGSNNVSVLQNPYHVYASSGTYMVMLSDTNIHGCYNDTAIAVIVNPRATPSFMFGTPCSGVPLQFNNTTDTAGISVTSWLWNFGDPGSGPNNTSSLKNPLHTYNTGGNYSVVLTVTLTNGCVATDTTVVQVGQAVVPSFSYFNTCIGEVTNFFTSVSGASLLWNFGDNSYSTQQSPLHQYAFVQTYQCTLTAVTAAGCTNSVVMPVTINDLPVAFFSAPPACVNTPYLLLDSSYISQGTVTQWQWKLPDLTTSTQQNPFYTFDDTLQYNITLIVASSQGCRDTITRLVSVHPLPAASFTSNVVYGDAPLPVNFNNLSSGAASYMWNFGDTSGTSAATNPSHTYTALGTYPVSLIASTAFGCTDTVVKFIYVLDPFLDLAVTGVNKTSGNNVISISAGIANLGNIAVTDFKISAWLESSLPVQESWTGNLLPQTILAPPYNFSASFEVPQINPPNFLCVEIFEVNGGQDDNLANNIRCINLDDDFVVADPYPNPAEQVINLQVVVSKKDFLSITVYDAAGKLIREIYNGTAAAGLNKFIFDTSSLAEGTYFCKFAFGEKTIVKPLTHISKKRK